MTERATGLTDFHSHLVPGVDDGAQDEHDCAFALERFRAEGAVAVITTPHFTGSLTLDAALRAERLAELDTGWAALQQVGAADAARHGTPLRLERGAEVMLDVPEPDLSDARVRLAGGPFVLVEYPGLRFPPMNAEYALVSIRRKGWIPVVGHPERYRNLDNALTTLLRFREAGAYLQVNAGSLFGAYGRTAAAHAQRLLSLGLAAYVSSDYHTRGEPGVAAFVHALTEAGFDEQADLLAVTNPARLLAGEPPLPVPAAQAAQGPSARPWWARLFGETG